MIRAPTHDASGLHILDPNDSLGWKSDYITRVQTSCLIKYLPRADGGVAADVGCGFGRLTPLLGELGWQAVGIDPSEELLEYAEVHHPGPVYLQGGLPKLPLAAEEVSLLLLQNVLRFFWIKGQIDLMSGVGAYVKKGGHVAVVDNIREGHPDFIPERVVLSLFEREGLTLVRRVPYRASRWWLLYMIRYGLVPARFFNAIAQWEIARMASRSSLPTWQYTNVLYLFSK